MRKNEEWIFKPTKTEILKDLACAVLLFAGMYATMFATFLFF